MPANVPVPAFAIADVGHGCFILNDRQRTVALISSQGYIDWLLRSPSQPGPLLTAIRKEAHLSYVLGLKLLLCLPTPTPQMTALRPSVSADGRQATLSGESRSEDGQFRGWTQAVIAVNPVTGWYEWTVETALKCVAERPVNLSWVEYNNLYPSGTGRCMLFAPEKRYHSTLMRDRDGTLWEFPHQHLMHYTRKINQLRFATGTFAGFFGEQDGSPVCIVHESSMEPDWAICDMYYDLHCGGRPAGPLAPGDVHRWRYAVKYFTPAETAPLVQAAKPVPVTDEDRARYDFPRFELGMNHFDAPVRVDRFDDASGFRVQPPKLVWDREVGRTGRGSLRIRHEQAEQTVWSAEPPTQIPNPAEFRLVGMVKTAGVAGKGLYLRVRYHTFVWHPTPHIEWTQTLCSPAVTGTTSDWVRIETPRLHVPDEHFDYLVWIDVVFEGQGTAWLTDVDVDLVRVRATAPVPA